VPDSEATRGSDIKKIMTENFRFSWMPEPGLELVDILTNAVRRGMMGNLKYEGWKDIRSLMIHRNNHYVNVLVLDRPDASQERSVRQQRARRGNPTPPANDRNEIEKAKALQKLLDMATERWPPPWDGLVPALEHFQRSKALMEMWPEACRRAGARALEFPRELIEQWQKGTSSKRPS
jgi:hypothetical protein